MRKFLKQIAATFTALMISAPFVHADAIKITAFGDSLVQGYGLAQGEGFVPQLQSWFEAQGLDVVVANAGVSGDTTAGGAARIDWTLADQPDAVIVLLGGNDLLRGLPPENARDNLSRIVEASQKAGAAVMLIGMQAPGNFGAAYKAEFDSIYADLAQDNGVVLHAFAFEGMVERAGDDPAQLGAFMQDDGIHPNADGVAANIAAMAPKLRELIEIIHPADAG